MIRRLFVFSLGLTLAMFLVVLFLRRSGADKYTFRFHYHQPEPASAP